MARPLIPHLLAILAIAAALGGCEGDPKVVCPVGFHAEGTFCYENAPVEDAAATQDSAVEDSASQATDAAAVPDDFVRIRREPDKTAIGAALASGADVPGATMANGMPQLRILTK